MWTLDNLRLIVEDESDSFSQTIARLNPLDDYTVYHIFGYESIVKKLSAKIVSFPDRAILLGFTRDGNTHQLSGVGINWGNYYVKSAGTKLEKTVSQSILLDENHDCLDPVFTCDIELYKEE